MQSRNDGEWILGRSIFVLFGIASILSVCFISILPFSIAEVQQTNGPWLKAKIDKKSYNLGDLLTISGNITSRSMGISDHNRPVTIMVLGPDLNLVHVEQIPVALDGTFSIPIKIEGPLWRLPGNYTIIAQGGFKHVSSKMTFEFEKSIIPSSNVTSVLDKQSGQVFDVNYTISGGKVQSISIVHQDITLALKIESKDQGSINLQIPRLLIDAKTNSNIDTPFLVYADDNEILSFNETSDQVYRVLTIPFSEGDSELKIIGTVIVPEFANIANLVFIMAIASTLIFSIFVKMKFNYKFSDTSTS